MLRMGVVIPAYKPGKKFSRLLKMFSMRAYPTGKIIVMNTEEAYQNEKDFEGIGNLEVHHLSGEEFGHGATRNRGARYGRMDTMVSMTDDTVLADEKLIENLTAALEKRGIGGESVIMAYARQLPDKGCTIAGRFTRPSDYPEGSCIKIREDLGRMGIKTSFISNVCCAYGGEEFWLQGGLIHKTTFNEDVIFVGKAVLQDNYAITYVAKARVIHSHNYGCAAQFRRNLDLVVSQADYPKIFGSIRLEGEGTHLVRQTTRYLVAHRRLWLVPGLIVKNGFEYAGHRPGRCCRFPPVKLVTAYSIDEEYRR